MVRLARTDPESLIKAVGKDFMGLLKTQGVAAVREATTAGLKRGLKSDQLSYLFWALSSPNTLPNMGSRQKVFNLMLNILDRTGTMPDYQRSFRAVKDPEVDDVVDAVALHMSQWAARTMAPALVLGYYRTLSRHANKVPEATEGAVQALSGSDYLNFTFREMLTIRSAWFDDGELLRRVVRFIPE